MNVDPGGAGNDGRVPVGDKLIPAQKAREAATEAEERAQHHPLREPGIPGVPADGGETPFTFFLFAGCPVLEQDRVVAVVPPGLSRPRIEQESDTRPGGDRDYKERDDEIHYLLIKRQGEKIEGQVLAEDRVRHARRRRAEERR